MKDDMTEFYRETPSASSFNSAMFARRPRLGGLSYGQPVFAAEGGNEGVVEGDTPPADKTPEPKTPDPKPADKTQAAQSAEDAKLLKEVMKAKEDNKALKEQLKAFDGIDPQAVRAMLTEAAAAKAAKEAADAKAEEDRLKAEGNYEALRSRMAEEHKKAIKERDERETTLTQRATQLEATISDLTIGRGFSDSPFVKDSLVLTPTKARVVYGGHFDVVDGKVVGFDKPRGTAGREPLVKADGKSLSFDEALKSIVEADPEKDQVLRSTTKAGTGTRSNSEVQSSTPNKLFGSARIAASMREAG